MEPGSFPRRSTLSRRAVLAGGLGAGAATLFPRAGAAEYRPPARTKPKPVDPVVLSTFNNNEMVARLIGSPTTKIFYNFPGFYREDPSIGIRDPAVAQFNGRYWMAYTRADRYDYLGLSNTWGLASSDSLGGFQRVAVLPTFAWVTKCWAPDLMVAGDRMYAYLSLASSSGVFSTWVTSTADGATWTTPQQVPGLEHAIDACVRPDGKAGYVGVIKDETTKRLTSIAGNHPAQLTRVQTVPTGERWVEGPALLRLSDRWRLFVDYYVDSEVGYLDTPDMKNWGPVQKMTYPDPNLRHVSAVSMESLPDPVRPGYGWQGLPLANGWHRGDPSCGDPQFRADDNVVRLRGAVAPGGGSGQTVGKVPSPVTTVEWAVTGRGPGGEHVRANVSVNPNGEVRVFYRGGTPTRGVSLTGSYRID